MERYLGYIVGIVLFFIIVLAMIIGGVFSVEYSIRYLAESNLWKIISKAVTIKIDRASLFILFLLFAHGINAKLFLLWFREQISLWFEERSLKEINLFKGVGYSVGFIVSIISMWWCLHSESSFEPNIFLVLFLIFGHGANISLFFLWFEEPNKKNFKTLGEFAYATGFLVSALLMVMHFTNDILFLSITEN